MIPGLLILLPLLNALCLLFIKGDGVKKIAFGFSLSGIFWSALAFYLFKGHSYPEMLGLDIPWIKSAGINLHLGMDGISLLMVMLTNVLVPFIVLASYKHNYNNRFYSLMFVMQTALVGVFTAMDGFLFYIFWELALIPIYFICLIWGGEGRGRITFKFFVYTLGGSLVMLVALLYVYLNTPGSHSFDIAALYKAGQDLSRDQQKYVFAAMFLAFAIKMPVFPFHTWQPDTYTVAPTAGTMLLSGIMLKMGVYGMIRWMIPMVPRGWDLYAGPAVALCVIGIVYASCLALVQRDFKRMLAYSSIAHVGLIAAGVLTFTKVGIAGGVMQMLAHGVNVVGLFFVADIIESRMHTREIGALGGIRSVAPKFALLYLIILLGSVALPLTNGFVGEFLLFNGLFEYIGLKGNILFVAFAGLTIILGAMYMLRSYQTMMLGGVNELTKGFVDLDRNEKIVLVGLAILVVVLGVYPQPLLDIINPAVDALRTNYQNGSIN
jgi:NADH-quinone oxidoreductase subunit M